MSANPNTTTTTPKRVLMVVANPTTSTTTGWPVGFWASELVHPWHAFTEAGYDVTIASPQGGAVRIDGLSDPRDESRYSADDLLSLGFLCSPEHAGLLESTARLDDLDLDAFDALVVCGGQAPMFSFRDDARLQAAIVRFFEAEKPTAALCHGTAALIDVRLSDGSYLIEGRTITGFANVEEEAADAAAGTKVMPWRIEDAARERGATTSRAACGRRSPSATAGSSPASSSTRARRSPSSSSRPSAPDRPSARRKDTARHAHRIHRGGPHRRQRRPPLRRRRPRGAAELLARPRVAGGARPRHRRARPFRQPGRGGRVRRGGLLLSPVATDRRRPRPSRLAGRQDRHRHDQPVRPRRRAAAARRTHRRPGQPGADARRQARQELQHAHLRLPGHGSDQDRTGADRAVLFLCGDHPDAKHIVSQLVEDAGFVSVDLGGLADATLMEAPRRPGAVYGEEYREPEARAVAAAVRSGSPIPPTPVYDAE